MNRNETTLTPAQTTTVELNDEILAFLLEQMALINPGCEQEALELLGRLNEVMERKNDQTKCKLRGGE